MLLLVNCVRFFLVGLIEKFRSLVGLGGDNFLVLLVDELSELNLFVGFF